MGGLRLGLPEWEVLREEKGRSYLSDHSGCKELKDRDREG